MVLISLIIPIYTIRIPVVRTFIKTRLLSSKSKEKRASARAPCSAHAPRPKRGQCHDNKDHAMTTTTPDGHRRHQARRYTLPSSTKVLSRKTSPGQSEPVVRRDRDPTQPQTNPTPQRCWRSAGDEGAQHSPGRFPSTQNTMG